MNKINLKHGILVMVADGEKVLFLKNEGNNLHPNLQLFQEMKQDNPATREQGSDSPGRYNDGPSVHRSAVEDTDWHRQGKERFAEEIADRLYKLAHHGIFDDIVLIAPPLMLGTMRKKLHKEVTDKVQAEIPKTLTNRPVTDIEAMLQAA
ncbi:host attachment protein [Mesorhizobium caraganae]|uniref:baeRF12 domain-containing protein n=1 Tax=Mesorhizobium caraganae TaxID=483206 RepID=UPI00193A8DA7|nr:host attachment family protein [Mesorhizobium caraganae]MBM2714299.1 host attachment protein [Mesorhizobium caraganae]